MPPRHAPGVPRYDLRGAASDPFYAVVPGGATIPVLVVATLATVIASEAVIAGAFTVLHQLAGLGLFPALRTEHTSRRHAGQIYIPAINWTMMVIVIALVLGFRSSSSLATAYGISVSLTMLIDTLLLAVVARTLWPRWRLWVLPLCAVFLVVDVAFVVANLAKVLQGGWFPLVLGIVLFTTVFVFVGNQLGDLVHAGLDPRVRGELDRARRRRWGRGEPDAELLDPDPLPPPVAAGQGAR